MATAPPAAAAAAAQNNHTAAIDNEGRYGSGALFMPPRFFEGRGTHLRCLLAVYEPGKAGSEAGIQNAAKALGRLKASVTKMMAALMDRSLLMREKYGKIYLTDAGFLMAKDLFRRLEILRERLPAMELELTEEEFQELVHTMAVNLPEHCRRQLAGRI